jgi:lipopolysaccharide transport system permease protein
MADLGTQMPKTGGESMNCEVECATEKKRGRVVVESDGLDACARRENIITILRPPCGWQLINLRELWQFRGLILQLAWRDVKVRYKQTILGVAWAVLQPALMMVVFTICFSRMAGVPSDDVPYPLFVYAGLLPWTFFAGAITHAGNSVIGSERLITKIYFPRLAIPIAAVGMASVDFVVALALLALLMLVYGVTWSASLLLLPVFFCLIALAALGVGTLLAALTVAYRDFRHATPFLVQLWMFATPTVYMQPESGASGGLRALLVLNPMAELIAAFRAAALGGPIAWEGVGISALAVTSIFLGGCLYFRKVEDRFADII